jgi:hypothetical protein
MPGGNGALTLEGRQVHFQLVAQGFVLMRIGEEQAAHSGPLYLSTVDLASIREKLGLSLLLEPAN